MKFTDSIWSTLKRIRKSLENRSSWKPQLYSYRLLGERTDRFLPLFKDLDESLDKSYMRMSFKSYVSLIILVTVSATFSIGFFTATILHFLMHAEVIRSILFGLGGGLLAGASTTIIFYIYPLQI